MKVFVYGTLRKGGALAPMLEGERIPAVLDGFTLFEYAGGAYPVAMSTPGRTVPVLGDLIEVAPEHYDHLYDVADMECNSGYTMDHVQVRTIRDHVVHDCLAFTWWHQDDDGIGAEVPSGDWLTHRMMIDAQVDAERQALAP